MAGGAPRKIKAEVAAARAPRRVCTWTEHKPLLVVVEREHVYERFFEGRARLRVLKCRVSSEEFLKPQPETAQHSMVLP